MFTIVGLVLLFICVFGGYIMAGGSMAPIIKAAPIETFIIVGAAVSAMLVGNSMEIFKGAFAGIGIAGVDDQRAHSAALGQMRTADLHWRGAKAVAGEHTGHTGTLVQQENSQVFAVGFAHAGFSDANAHAGDRAQL